MQVVDTGIVYRNPAPHVCSRHAYFPSLVVRPDGELVVAMDIGSAFEAVDVRSHICRSTDGGKTWSDPQKMYEPDTSVHAVSVTTRVGQLGDGSLLGWASLFDRTLVDLGLVNPKTDGFVPTEFATIRSTDGGRTWTSLRPVKLPVAWNEFENCSPVIQVAPQRWVVPASPMKNFNGETTTLPPGLVWTSTDRGETWTGHVETFGETDSGLSALEQKLTRLSDGRWLVVCWSIDAKGQTTPNRFAIADEQATAFGPWRSTGIPGETCTPVALPDNQVLCVYRSFEKPGLWGHLASVKGDGWVPQDSACIWDGSNAPRAGLAERQTELRSMKDLRFGYPSVARLPDGDVLIVFWCVERCVGNIRWIRVKI